MKQKQAVILAHGLTTDLGAWKSQDQIMSLITTPFIAYKHLGFWVSSLKEAGMRELVSQDRSCPAIYNHSMCSEDEMYTKVK